MNFILSPCGTSLLTNEAKNEEKQIITKNANAKSEKEIQPDEITQIKNIIKRSQSNLEKSDKNQARKLSAELNGIITFYEKNPQLKAENDHHYLISTDTFLGKETAEMIKKWLTHNYNNNIYILTFSGLQTRNYSEFKNSMVELTKTLDETINNIDRSHNKIIFNLTGGFKSVQGYLQALGMLWNVDEIIYIFEQSSELISIPKLPIKIDMSIFEEESNLKFFRRLDIGLKVDHGKAKNLPQSLFEETEDMIDFSNWGAALWRQAKNKIYNQKLLDPPSLKIKFSDKFKDSAKDLGQRFKDINEKIDDLAKFAESKDKHSANIESLDFKPLKGNPSPPSTHEIDAWHDQDAKRIFCHYEDDVLVLDKLDKGLH